jgi:3-oxoacyl-[acyl-carrier protein] reductase
MALGTDLLRSGAAADMAKAVLERWGAIDVLVNSAGGFDTFTPIAQITDEDWDRVVALNLKTVFLCSRAVVPGMMARKRGRIINIASQAGIAPNPYAPSYLPYGAAKAGVIGFTRLLARDLGEHGITVNSISPGTTATDRVRAVRGAETLAKMATLNPMRSLVEPEDSAAAAVFLASEDARYITGANLNVNAGSVM